jgi:hypothetical protein
MEVQQLPCLGGSLLPNPYLYYTLFVTDLQIYRDLLFQSYYQVLLSILKEYSIIPQIQGRFTSFKSFALKGHHGSPRRL